MRDRSRNASFLLLILFIAISACKKGPKGDGAASPTPASSPQTTYRTDLPGVCREIPDGNSTAACSPQLPRYRGLVQSTMNELPKSLTTGINVIRDIKIYTDALTAALSVKGACGIWDGHRLYVRKQNENVGEYYTLVNADGSRVYPITYTRTCAPAAPFPHQQYPEDWANADPECALPAADRGSVRGAHYTDNPPGASSNDLSHYKNDVLGALDHVIEEERAHPTGMINFNEKYGAQPGWRLTSEEQMWIFSEKLRIEFRVRGLCSGRDNENIAVKKVNQFSENWDFLIKRTGEDGIERIYIWNRYASLAEPADF